MHLPEGETEAHGLHAIRAVPPRSWPNSTAHWPPSAHPLPAPRPIATTAPAPARCCCRRHRCWLRCVDGAHGPPTVTMATTCAPPRLEGRGRAADPRPGHPRVVQKQDTPTTCAGVAPRRRRDRGRDGPPTPVPRPISIRAKADSPGIAPTTCSQGMAGGNGSGADAAPWVRRRRGDDRDAVPVRTGRVGDASPRARPGTPKDGQPHTGRSGGGRRQRVRPCSHGARHATTSPVRNSAIGTTRGPEPGSARAPPTRSDSTSTPVARRAPARDRWHTPRGPPAGRREPEPARSSWPRHRAPPPTASQSGGDLTIEATAPGGVPARDRERRLPPVLVAIKKERARRPAHEPALVVSGGRLGIGDLPGHAHHLAPHRDGFPPAWPAAWSRSSSRACPGSGRDPPRRH